MSTSVVLVDDHPVFRSGLRSLLASSAEFEVAGEACDAAGALDLAAHVRPGIMLMDVALGPDDGIAAAMQVMKISGKTRVLALSMHASDFYVARALGAGIAGYAVKTDCTAEIVSAIRTVARGETYLPTRHQHLALTIDRDLDGIDPFGALSPREHQVFCLTLNGATNESMARELAISVKTVETHRFHINRKLRVHSTAELVRLAALHGLVGVTTESRVPDVAVSVGELVEPT